jgi:hypothetical protein
MSERHIAPPQAQPVATPQKFDIVDLITQIINGIGAVVMTLPIWARIVVVCAALCVAGAVIYFRYPPPNQTPIAKQSATLTYKVASIARDAQGQVTAALQANPFSPVNIVNLPVGVSIPHDHSFDGTFTVSNVVQDHAGVWELIWSQGPAQPSSAAEGLITTQPYSGGTKIPGPHDQNNLPQNREADDKSKEDSVAWTWHHADHSSEDGGNEKAITASDQNGIDADPDNYVHSRYYSKTDKCVEILRREGGELLPSQWIKDRRYHKHDIHPVSSSLDQPTHTEVAEALAFVQLDDLFPFQKLQMKPTQAQFCINPHPGNFRYWWGTPFDGCNSPMYRQFSDGCTHYQIYNRCANAWDPQIYWTFCHPPAHY